MHLRTNILLLKTTFILLFFISMNTATAYSNTRADRWEFFLSPMLTNAKVLQFDNGAEADINKHSSLGFGFGYNMNKHIELSLVFAAGNANYTGTRIADDSAKTPEKFTANLHTSKMDFAFTYNLFDSALTPYLSANIGSTYIDSGVPTGNITTICWWDPWWGYVCGPSAQTYTSTEINYGAGIGLRYDFNRKLFMKGGITKNYLDINSSNKPDFTTYQFIFGFMF